MKKVLIFDLDNTIYPVKSIGDKLFAPLFELLNNYRGQIGDEKLQEAIEEIQQRPFQKVADKYSFDEEIKQKGIELLRNLEYNGEMKPFDDYHLTRELQADKFLVTTGFTKLQNSKVENLNLRNDFSEIIIVDPEETERTKKEIFLEILEKNDYRKEEVLVIGDDPESEIEAAKSIGIDTFLYDPEGLQPEGLATYKGRHFSELRNYV